MQPGNGFLGTGLSPKKVGIIAMVVLGLLTVGRWMVRELPVMTSSNPLRAVI